jgi:hypothetical protein
MKEKLGLTKISRGIDKNVKGGLTKISILIYILILQMNILSKNFGKIIHMHVRVRKKIVRSILNRMIVRKLENKYRYLNGN